MVGEGQRDGGRDGGGGVEWSDGGRGREGGGCGVKGEWYSHIIPSLLLVGGRFRTWRIVFVCGPSVSCMGGRFRTKQSLGGRLHIWMVVFCENLGTFYCRSTSLYINLHISHHIYILNPSLGLTLSFEFILLAHMFID